MIDILLACHIGQAQNGKYARRDQSGSSPKRSEACPLRQTARGNKLMNARYAIDNLLATAVVWKAWLRYSHSAR
ncbi:hypothetical protein AAFN47_25980 [Hoeflea sp. CAU 1731]